MRAKEITTSVLRLEITVAEAAALEEELGVAASGSITYPIYMALCDFLEKHEDDEAR